MGTIASPGVRSATTRRVGYIVAAVVNVVLWYAINVRPGWQVVPFLTEDMSNVVGLINLSLVAGIVANLLYVAYDAGWVRPLGELLTTGIGLVALVRIVQVFPFAFDATSFGSPSVVRVVLYVAIFGATVGVIVQFVALVRRLIDDAA